MRVLPIIGAVTILGVSGAVVSGIPRDLFNERAEKVYTDCDLAAPRAEEIRNSIANYRAKNPDDSLRSLTVQERGSFKGCEIAKLRNLPRERVRFSGADIEVEIVEMAPIDGGVELFARAWNPDGTQLAFGDGTVELERFRIFNPPILVDDPNGDVTVTWMQEDIETGATVEHTRTMREDPKQALLEALAHTIGVMKNKHTSERMIPGKRGNTTSTFFTGVGDGYTAGNNAAFATARSTAVVASVTDTELTIATGAGITVGKTGGGAFVVYRGFFPFDTSAINDTDPITSATFSFFVPDVSDSDNDANAYLTVLLSSQASNTTLTTSDHGSIGTTEQIDAGMRKDITSISASAYLDFTLNATGRGNISKTSYTKLGVREGHDFANDAYTGANGTRSGTGVRFSEFAGTSSDPKLVIEHGSAARAVEDVMYY